MTDCGTILVVDHDEATRIAAVNVAVRLGYAVNSAENAELLLERLDENRPALAIVEVDLPGPSSGLLAEPMLPRGPPPRRPTTGHSPISSSSGRSGWIDDFCADDSG